MAASDGSASGGFLRGHSVAFALLAIFAGMALAVAYAASDGAIFGLGTSSSSDRGLPVSNGSTGGAAVISRDSFEQESVPVEQNEASAPAPTPPTESGTTLSEEERELLSMSDFSWDSVAGSYIASNQNSMDRFRKPVPVQPGTEPLSMSDAVVVNVDRARNVIEDEEQDDFELADIIDIDIPIDSSEEQTDGDDEDQPNAGEQEEPQNDEDQQDNGGSEGPDDDSSGEGPGDNSGSGSEDDDDQPDSDGNSTDTGNSTSTQETSENSGSGSEDSDDSSDIETTITFE